MRAWDAHAFADAFAGEERQWFSYGVVDGDGEGNAKVVLDDGSGGAPTYGPQVFVTLQPSGVSIPCRVAMQVAGDGEGEWYPFVQGDEVLVALPEGHERAGAAIVGRMNQEIDRWPTVVAGQDAKKNSFGFRRMRAPFVLETSAGYLIRNATTGAQVGIDDKGQVIISDGDRGKLVLGPDGLGLESGDGDSFVQIFPSAAEVMIGAGAASFTVSETETKFISQGPISFATNGAMANGTAVTAEQVVALFINVLAQLASVPGTFSAGPLGATYAVTPPISCQAALAGIMSAALAAMAGPNPVGPAPGGEFLEFQGLGVFGVAGAITAAMSNPLAPVDVSGAFLGFGRPGFRL